MDILLKNSETCVKELQKCKTEIRTLNATKNKEKRMDVCKQNDDFRKKFGIHCEFVENNRSKLECLLKGERDVCPPDIGKGNFRKRKNLKSEFFRVLDLFPICWKC